MSRIVLVEDDPRISEPLVRMLQVEGFDVEHFADGEGAVAAVLSDRPDLVLLDLSLPDVDGLDVCRQLRQRDPTLPIVMLTARSEEMDVVVGFGAGADDYVVKPFRLAELMARIRARLRVTPASERRAVAAGGVDVDLAARRAWLRGSEIELTAKEFDLLALLVREAGRTVRREDIMTQVWDENWWGSTRTLDTHVSTLRRKLDDDGDPPHHIVTVRGVGFRFEP